MLYVENLCAKRSVRRRYVVHFVVDIVIYKLSLCFNIYKFTFICSSPYWDAERIINKRSCMSWTTLPEYIPSFHYYYLYLYNVSMVLVAYSCGEVRYKTTFCLSLCSYRVCVYIYIYIYVSYIASTKETYTPISSWSSISE